MNIYSHLYVDNQFRITNSVAMISMLMVIQREATNPSSSFVLNLPLSFAAQHLLFALLADGSSSLPHNS
jgi:hypothetical protein